MYLGSYRFRGDPSQLVVAYDRLMAEFPSDAILLHVAITVDDGLLIIDACPSETDFEAFSAGPGFAAAVRRAGLPDPVVQPLGAVHAARAARG